MSADRIFGPWAWGALVALAMAGSLGMAANAQAPAAANAFAFTAPQATRGKTVYDDNCVGCHGGDLNGGQFATSLRDVAFKDHWLGKSSADLLGFIVAKMPPSAPNSLLGSSYADVAAYLLQANGIAPGAKEIAALSDDADAPKLINQDAIFAASDARGKALLNAMKPVTDAMLLNPPDGDWLTSSRTYQALAFSPLKQINRATVHDLRSVWSVTLPPTNNETTPIVHDGIMFLAAGGNVVLALNAATGDLMWRYNRSIPPALYTFRAARAKSMALYDDKLYVPTADGHVVALDASNGHVMWDNEVIPRDQNAHAGEKRLAPLRLNGAPLIVHGKVILGASSGQDARGGSFIAALDAETGKEVWRFMTIARPGEPGGDSWNGAPVDQRFGAGVWETGSYDVKRNLVFFGTGNTYDTDVLLLPQKKPGASNDALYTDSTLALNPDTGKLVWAYQHMQRDVWDMDWTFERSLITLPVKGKPTDVVLTSGKLGIFDAMDRQTGKYLFSKDVGLQSLVTGIDPITGHKRTDPALEPEDGKTKLLCPHTNGVRNWMTTAIDPSTDILYVPMLDACGGYQWIARKPEEMANGGVDISQDLRARPNSDGKFGQIDAIDLHTGKLVWKLRQRAPLESSLLATAGGLVFSGSFDRLFHAYDAATGKLLWQTAVNLPPNSSPVTYTVNGRQYVAIVAGGGGPADSGAALLAPEIYSPGGNATVWVYALAH